MTINFLSVKLKNFLSYADAEINLQDKGFCLIRGQNNCEADSALSNGSGKSAIVNSICWCLTGETISGVKNDVKNIYIEDNECWVEVEFKVNNDLYRIRRLNKPKSDLKIYINDEDKSGKGVRESEAQFEKLVPDLSRDLITSTILLGQGLPNRLSMRTPSGRKDLLEKLTKCDFMINDIKQRMELRQVALKGQQRQLEDEKIALSAENNIHSSAAEKATESLKVLNEVNYDTEILDLTAQINTADKAKKEAKQIIDRTDEKVLELYQQITQIDKTKQRETEQLNTDYSAQKIGLQSKITELQLNINALNKEITNAKNIKDICPTCGQKIIGVVIPDTTKQEEQIKTITAELEEYKNKLNDLNNRYTEVLKELTEAYSTKESNELLDQIKLENKKAKSTEADLNKTLLDLNSKLTAANSNKANLENNKKQLQDTIDTAVKSINENNSKIKDIDKNLTAINDHLDVLKQIDTLIKRDFRGYLLENVLAFLDKQMKTYAVKLFNHDNIGIKQNGNDIDLSFNGKVAEVLSGGERQKLDLITQFALRDLLQQYMDIRCNLLFLDEVTDNLDEIGCSNIFTLISQLNSIDSIFIISHHAQELQIPVDSEITVIKNNNGISKVAE